MRLSVFCNTTPVVILRAPGALLQVVPGDKIHAMHDIMPFSGLCALGSIWLDNILLVVMLLTVNCG